MKCLQKILHNYRLAFLTAAALLTITAYSDNDIDKKIVDIRIHGGGAHGTYNRLIDTLNTRSNTTRNLGSNNPFGETELLCEESSEGCPLIAKFNFVPICNNGNSKNNLLRLGMKTKGGSPESELDPACTKFQESDTDTIAEFHDNDFAIVQNYFIAGASQSYCPPSFNRPGPDFLYFQFTSSFPFVVTDAKQQCDAFYEEQMDGKYEKFEDLRVVLPLYSGVVQFVTASTNSSIEERTSLRDLYKKPQAIQTLIDQLRTTENELPATVELLELLKKRIYLQGSNRAYGSEILARDPIFQNEYRDNNSPKDWGFDESIVLDQGDLEKLPYNEEILNFINPGRTDTSLSIGQSVRGDRMLACGIIDAYVISGEIISEEDISHPSGVQVPSACAGTYQRQQIQIPEVIIDSIAAEFPYYQKLPPPESWNDSHIIAVPGLITHLVTTASADPTLVYEVTAALEAEWDNLTAAFKARSDQEKRSDVLAEIRTNVAQPPAPFHEGAERVLLEKNLLVYETHKTINIHGGSKGGPYNELIQLLNTRARTLRSNIVSNDKGQQTDCVIFQEGCPLLSKFNFTSMCQDGGSKKNLTRLGMQKAVDETGEELDGQASPSNVICQTSQDNDFALAQNFFVAGAAQTYCPYQQIGPGSYFSTDPEIQEKCDIYFEEQMDGKYQAFDDLRVVMPLYNGLVQFVTAKNLSLDQESVTEVPTLDSLRVSQEQLVERLKNLKASEHHPLSVDLPTAESVHLASLKKRIYLRGVNAIYGAEILNRDPRFQNENIDNSIRKDWLFDEGIVLGPEDLTGLYYSDEILDFINPERGDLEDDSLKIGESVRGDRMLACDIIDAYVISGEIIAEEVISHPSNVQVPAACSGNYQRQQIQIPEVIIDAMATDHPYYQKLSPPAYWGETHITAMPALITYLVTTASADEELVSDLTMALNEDWSSLMLLEKELSPIRENILKKPAPFHKGAEKALFELEMLGGGIPPSQFLLIALFIIAIYFVHRRLSSSMEYNRLGEKQRRGVTNLVLQEFLDILFILSVWVFVFMLVVTLIRDWDAAIAATQNADDQISGLSLDRTLLWMFTFISSGYEDNVFPSSRLSQLVVGFFAMAGVAYPLYLIAKAWDRIRLRRLSHERGGEFRGIWRIAKDFLWSWPFLGKPRSKGTLLLCGWNDRAPGLIYTLTCPDSPFEGMLNIVANPDADRPIEFYKFNKKRVRFYRGDASHRSELERAEAGRADSALVLSESSKSFGKDNTGLLTALAIEQYKQQIAVFAELSVDKGDREFIKRHVDNIVDPRLIARQVLTIGCFDSYVLDFVLDALSPDDHFEWYSKPVSELKNRLPRNSKTETVAELSNSLQPYGISIIGICPNIEAKNGSVFAPRFDSHLQLDSLNSIAELHTRTLDKDDDYVICAAFNPKSFKMKKVLRTLESEDPKVTFSESTDSIVKPLRSNVSILIVGHKEQAESIAQYIGETVVRNAATTATYTSSIIATDSLTDGDLEDAIETQLESAEWSHVLLLSSIPQSQNQEEHTRLATRADSDTILRASFIRSAIENSGGNQPYITAEVNRTTSRQLSKDAKIDTVVPSSLLVERLLARLVSGGGKVSAMLSAMLSMDDDVCLRSTKLHLGKDGNSHHPLIGKKFSTALNTWHKDGRVLGILPKGSSHNFQAIYRKKTWHKANYFWLKNQWPFNISGRNTQVNSKEKYLNSSDDFDWHFIMSPPSAEEDRHLQEGDVVIILDYSRS